MDYIDPRGRHSSMDSEVRHRRREEAAATKEKIQEIRRRMKAGETWQSRVNRLLALLYPLLFFLILALGLYCGYMYWQARRLQEAQGKEQEQEQELGGILQEQEEEVEEILAEEE